MFPARAQSAPSAAVLHYPDIVLVGGKVPTVDDRSGVQEALAIREDRIPKIRSVLTIVGGKVVYEAVPAQ